MRWKIEDSFETDSIVGCLEHKGRFESGGCHVILCFCIWEIKNIGVGKCLLLFLYKVGRSPTKVGKIHLGFFCYLTTVPVVLMPLQL